MNAILRLVFSVLITSQCFADSLPPNVVKVNKENNPNCVEFISYQGEMYCSTKALENTPADPHIMSYEQQAIHFDTRPWKAAWGKKTAQISTVEYITVGDNINQWHELVTSQCIPGASSLTPMQLKERFMEQLTQAGITFKVQILEDKPDQVIFGYKVEAPDNLKQNELLKITKTKNGFYLLHYAVKIPSMNEAQRDLWLDNLKKSTIIK